MAAEYVPHRDADMLETVGIFARNAIKSLTYDDYVDGAPAIYPYGYFGRPAEHHVHTSGKSGGDGLLKMRMHYAPKFDGVFSGH
jgi:hypothetical protein